MLIKFDQKTYLTALLLTNELASFYLFSLIEITLQALRGITPHNTLK